MSELALKLIAENRKTREPFLDLARCGLSRAPGELAGMDWLREISFADARTGWSDGRFNYKRTRNEGPENSVLEDLGVLAHLGGLRAVYIAGTAVADLAPLAGLQTLEVVDLDRTRVQSFEALQRLRRLKFLSFGRTTIRDLAPLAAASDLRGIEAFGCEVQDLAPLAAMPSLQFLNLRECKWVNDLRPLATLRHLQTLNLSSSSIGDIDVLAGLAELADLELSRTGVRRIAPVVRLPKLSRLRLDELEIDDISELVHARALAELSLSGSRFGGLPRPLPARLTTIDLSDTAPGDLGPLGDLQRLNWLSLRRAAPANLEALAALPESLRLDLAGVAIKDLSPLLPLIQRGMDVTTNSAIASESVIVVDGCPLETPPIEIVEQGSQAVLNYFAEREADAVDHLYEAKMLILGEGSAGKTSLLRRLYRPGMPLPTERDSTKGIEIHRHEFGLPNGRRFRLNVWDFGGQEIYHATHQFFLTQRSLYLLLDDTRKDHKTVFDEGYRYWLDLIDVFGGHSPVLVFQNEKGGRSKAVDEGGIKGRYDNVQGFWSGNLESPDSADRLRTAIEYHAPALKHIGETLPARWLRVRQEIEARAETDAHITVEQYFEIYRHEIEFNRTKALLLSRYLHDLGVFLHFQDDPLLERIVILRNTWATTAVFRILDDELIKERRGRFGLDDCKRLWGDAVYAGKQPELLALMQRFELCYELHNSRPRTWLAPQLLSPARPPALETWPRPDDLALRYRYDFLPKGMLARLIVRLHRFVADPEFAWTTGAMFEDADTSSSALAQVLGAGREIELRSRGPERRALLATLASEIDALNAGIRGLRDRVDKRIPCSCKLCRVSEQPEFFAQRQLVKRREDGKLRIECPASYEDVDVLELLDGIRTDATRDTKPATKPGSGAQLRRLRIFLASSKELEKDRDAFDLYFSHLNDELVDQGLFIKIVRWEYFLDAMSETRLQDEYNSEIEKCDILVALFATKTGPRTREEFEVALKHYREHGSPRIFTYFKGVDVNTLELDSDDLMSLIEFKKHLKGLGHDPTPYEHVEGLRRHFADQLRLLGVRP